MFVYVPKVKAGPNETTRTFYCLNYDGEIYYIVAGGTYGEARNASSGVVINALDYFDVGQWSDGGFDFKVNRAFLFFDTSEIGFQSNVSTAVLSFYLKTDHSDTDFNITIQNGQPTYPHDPLEEEDYLHTLYSGDGGQLNTSNFVAGYNNITLNDTSWVNMEEVTRLCLRSSRDINYNEPSGDEYVSIYTREKGLSYAPRLIVTYQYWEKDEESTSGGDTGDGEPTSPIDIPEITVPKIPVWGYYLILGSVCIVALTSIFTKAPRSKHGPKGVKVKKTSKRYPKRNKKGRFT